MAVARQMRRHRPDNGLTLSQMQLLGEISRAGRDHARRTRRPDARAGAVADRHINELVAAAADRAPTRRRRPPPPAHRDHRRGRDAAGGRPRRARRVAARDHARHPVRAGIRPADAGRAGAAQARGSERAEADAAAVHTARPIRLWWGARDDASWRPPCRSGSPTTPIRAPPPSWQRAAHDELDDRFAQPLTFGTAGLRGPLRGGPNGMNLAVVLRATWAVAKVLNDRGLGGSPVVVGRDARHRSDEFARAAAEVLAAQGFSVTLMSSPVPTPVVAFAVRQHAAPPQGCRSPRRTTRPSDNGYKVYFDGGLQIVPPTDREIEQAIAEAPPADEIPRAPVTVGGVEQVRGYVERAATVRRTTGSVRVALTAAARRRRRVRPRRAGSAPGFTDVHVVDSQFAPDPGLSRPWRSPTPRSPAPPTRCWRWPPTSTPTSPSRWIPTPTGARSGSRRPTAGGCSPATKPVGCWAITSCRTVRDPATAVVASTVVSSRMLAAIAADHGARHVETLTGFKWLARADADLAGGTLVYAYEEAIGHCVDPAAVRDKDGISAAVLVCDLVAALRAAGRHGARRARRPGPSPRRAHHHGGVPPGRDAGEATLMARLRADPPARWPVSASRRPTLAPTHRRPDLHRRRRCHVGAGGRPAVGNRAERSSATSRFAARRMTDVGEPAGRDRRSRRARRTVCRRHDC